MAPCTRDFSRASNELQVNARNCDWFIALLLLWLVGVIALVLVFRQSFENRSRRENGNVSSTPRLCSFFSCTVPEWFPWNWSFSSCPCVHVKRTYCEPQFVSKRLFPEVPKLFGSILDATIHIITSQCRGSKSSNFAILSVFLTIKTC